MRKAFLPVLFLLATTVAHAQFYAPDTEFHDRSQRTFPVEAARVLAWRQNGAQDLIASVTYKLEMTEARESVWHIQWLDAGKNPVREKEVRYPESLLAEGPTFFREVFRQLCGDDWRPKAGAPAGLDAAFWEGAKLAGVSRLEALGAAGAFTAGVRQSGASAADAARIAGTLAHGTMPLLGNGLTLDGLLLSRAAAWLCLAEQLAGMPDDAAWTPILFLSGRERPARAVWQAAVPSPGTERGAAGRFWDLILRTPSTKDCFLFAAQKDQRQFALPAMLYPAQFDRAWMTLLVEVSDEVVGREMMPRLFEYGPNVSTRGGVGGGHWGARMVGGAMGQWLEALSAFQPPPHDYTSYQPVLKKALSAARAAGNDESASITALAPLVNLGLDEGGGALIPLATVTARDLLGYGWETAGLQFGYTHNFLSGNLGDPEGAEAIARPALDQFKGVDPFFKKPKVAPRNPLRDLRRLQYVGSSLSEGAFMENLPNDWKTPPARYLSRRWLDRGGINGFEMLVRGKAKPEELRAMLDRMRREGGPLAVCNLVNHDPGYKYPAVIDLLDLRGELLAEMPWTYQERVKAMDEEGREGSKLHAFDRAQALEKLGWEHLAFPNHYLIFTQYLIGNAEASAKRFYDQVQPFVTERVGFSNNTGPARYALAWIEDDEKMKRRAIEDSATFSHSDLKMQITDAVLRNDVARATKVIDACVERYNGRNEPLIKDWLPLLPALLDPQHADYGRALDTFPDDQSWIFLRWALARQSKLSVEDTVRLFRGKTDGAEGIFAAAARGDKNRFLALYTQVTLPAMARVVITHEFLKLNNYPQPKEQPDLKPPGARPIDELVREELRRQKE